MKFACPVNLLAKLSLSLFVLIGLFASESYAQTKKPAAKPTPKAATVAKVTKKAPAKTTKAAAKKAPAKKTSASRSTSSKSKSAAASKKAPQRGTKQTASSKKAQTKKAKTTAKSSKKLTPAQRRAEAKRKKAEEARRLAREKAAREARERKLAFERGLRTESVANIQNDVTDGEDLRVRAAAVEALGGRAGTVVVMEAKTGRIVTMVNQDWAIRNTFKPCSTIKLVTAVAGLNENIITPSGEIVGENSRMGLDDALAYSNNAYFQRVGSNLGNEKMIEYARRLGLGQPTGINAEGEVPGRLPFGNNNLRVYSHADDFEVTPLQLAVMVSAISNGGGRVVPYISRTRIEKSGFKPHYTGEIGLPMDNVRGVIPGMIGAAEYGTARRGTDPAYGIAGKTGSCIGKGSWVGLFASVAPIEDPAYSVVVITRGESERGKYAAAVAGKVYQALSSGIERNMEKNLALRRQKPKAAEEGDLALADEEEEDTDASESDQAVPDEPRKIIIVGAPNPAAAGKKAVTKTAQSKPVFPPVIIDANKDKEAKPKSAFPPVVIEYKKDKEAENKPAEEKPRPRIVKNN